MSEELFKHVMTLQPGDLIEIKTSKGGTYVREKMTQVERDGGSRPKDPEICDLTHYGRFSGVLSKDSDHRFGPFIDNYLQIEIVGEKAVFKENNEHLRLTGWSISSKLMSVPFRNIQAIVVKN